MPGRPAWRQRRGFHLALLASWIPLTGLIIGSSGRGGMVLGAANQFEQAAQAFEDALKVDPSNASAAANLAQIQRILQQRR